MNIFETLGPKLRKAILMTESKSRILRRMKSGIVVSEFPSGSGPHNVAAQTQQLAKSIDVFGPEHWNRSTLAHEISHIAKPYDPLRKRTGRLRVMLDKLKEQRNSFLTRQKELPRIKERADKTEELLRRVDARSEAKANFYGKQKHLQGREYDWHKDANGELPPRLAKRMQAYKTDLESPDYYTRSKAYLRLSAVARAGNLQEAKSGGYKFSSTQVALPSALAQEIMAYGKQLVKDKDLTDDGRDTHPHITIKYGLHTNDPREVVRALRGVGPIKYKLGAISKFKAPDYDVLKIEVISDDLKRVNARLRKLLKCTDTHPTYNPHVTIAYVRKGFPIPRSRAVFEGATGVADVVEFSAKNGKMHKLKLAQGRGSKMREALSEQTRAMIPKNKFAAPTMERAGHADKGLYPIFDKTSAKSALKLSGKHPHLKREITRRAAVYGVKPEKKGTKYA